VLSHCLFGIDLAKRLTRVSLRFRERLGTRRVPLSFLRLELDLDRLSRQHFCSKAFVVCMEFWLGLAVRYRLRRRKRMESPSLDLVRNLLLGGPLRLDHFAFRLQPELNQAADGFRAARLVILHRSRMPGVRQMNGTAAAMHKRNTTSARPTPKSRSATSCPIAVRLPPMAIGKTEDAYFRKINAESTSINHKRLRCVGTGGSRGSMSYCSPSPQGCLALLLGNALLGGRMMVAMIRGSKVAAIIAWPSPVRWMKSKV
jgi:hypothetical protein